MKVVLAEGTHFNLSKKAWERLMELRAHEDPIFECMDLPDWAEFYRKWPDENGEIFESDHEVGLDMELRTHPILVQLCEELGEAAGSIRVIEVPDDVPDCVVHVWVDQDGDCDGEVLMRPTTYWESINGKAVRRVWP